MRDEMKLEHMVTAETIDLPLVLNVLFMSL